MVKWDIKNRAAVRPGTGEHMIQLPAGATGFFEANAAREPISQKEFLQLAHRLARENRGILRAADTD